MAANFEMKGHLDVLKNVAKMTDAPRLLDPVYTKAVLNSVRELINDTPKLTGTIARQWSMPNKKGPCNYLVSNYAQTRDRQHSMIEILDKGRGPVYPKKALRLYIPLTNKGRAKALGAPPTGLVYGVDFIYAKKAGPAAGKNFVQPNIDRTEQRIMEDSIGVFM